MKYFLYLLLLLASCQSKEKESPIVGTWEYDKIELYSGVTLNDFQDSLFNVLEGQQKGLSLSFTKENIFKVTQKKGNGKEEFIAEQPYELPEDKKSLILKNTGRPDDNFPIIELSNNLLKINMFKSKEGYLVFRKKE